jgi:hypothetical protein
VIPEAPKPSVGDSSLQKPEQSEAVQKLETAPSADNLDLPGNDDSCQLLFSNKY